MPAFRWELHDPITPQTYIVELNPRELEGPAKKKRFVRTPTTAPANEGRTLVFEGSDEPQTLRWTGVIRTQEFYEALSLWYDKRHQIRLTDDLGRIFWIVISEFSPTRINRVNEPWAHNYTLGALILDVEE